MTKHAMLSASGASRWLSCTPSARYEKNFAATESDYADEGTLAHELSNILIGERLYGRDQFYDQRILEVTTNKWYSEEMQQVCDEFADYVINIVNSIPGSYLIFLEQRLNMTEWIPEGFGTVDILIVFEGTIWVIDLKYGKGVPVDSYENNQLMVYALGGLREVELLYDIRNVKLTIYQPRIDNISTFDTTVANLMRWANETLAPGAQIAWAGEGKFVAGSHCRFCRAKAQCPTNAAYNLQVIKLSQLPVPTLTDEQVVKILGRSASLKQWLTAVEEMALHSALAGHIYPGKKVVFGKSNRKYTDEETIVNDLINVGYPEEKIVNKKITGITNLSKILTKLDFQKYVEPYVVKPPGSPTLVDESDKREAYDGPSSIASDFEDESNKG